MIDCNEAVRQLWEYLENELEVEDKNNMDEHLSFCRTCCGEVEFAEELRTVMKGAAKPEVPKDVAARLGEFLDKLEDSEA
jgi:anti-sigma factor (TIGR02949 family)